MYSKKKRVETIRQIKIIPIKQLRTAAAKQWLSMSTER
jgi:hypothetical protein